MLITYVRSSSHSRLGWCPHAFFIEYNLGYKFEANSAAVKGNMFHKVMEICALGKLAHQQNKNFIIDEDFGNLTLKQCNPFKILPQVFDLYAERESYISWTKKDKIDVQTWLESWLKYEDGHYDPRKRIVLQPELHFDQIIEKDWAKYSYEYMGQKIEGYLGIKGTIDIIYDDGDNLIEVCDYKTGQSKKDWNTGKEKDFVDLVKTFQFMLYYYAVRRLFPDKTIYFTALYVRAGGAYTLPYTDKTLDEVERELKSHFEIIQSIKVPILNVTWKCTKLCGAGKTYHSNGMTVCEFIKNAIKKKGMDRVIEEHTQEGFDLLSYGAGGGKERREN